MDNHIIGDPRRQLHQLPIEVNRTIFAARSPPIAKIADINSRRCNPHFSSQQIYTLTKPDAPDLNIPTSEMIRGFRPSPCAQQKILAVKAQRLQPSGNDFESVTSA